MPQKDFDLWNVMKKDIDVQEREAFCHPREIWWCSLGVNIGYEQNGTGENFDRPVVVIRGFSEKFFFGIALTGRKRSGKYHFYIGEVEGRDASAILSQVRTIDAKRLVKKLGMLDEVTFMQMKKAAQELLFGQKIER